MFLYTQLIIYSDLEIQLYVNNVIWLIEIGERVSTTIEIRSVKHAHFLPGIKHFLPKSDKFREPMTFLFVISILPFLQRAE